MAKEVLKVEGLSSAFRKRIADTKRLVLGAVEHFKGFTERVNKIAPDIIRLFNDIRADRPVGTFGLADFARFYDPSVPLNSRANKDGDAGYTQHPTYRALAYMERSIREANRQRSEGGQGVFNGANKKLERAIKTILTVVSDQEAFWKAIGQELRGGDGSPMDARTVKALRARVAKVEPFLDLSKVIKTPVDISKAPVVHMAWNSGEGKPGANVVSHAAAAAKRGRAAGGVNLAQPGRRVSVGGARKTA